MATRNPTEYTTPDLADIEPLDYLEYTPIDKIISGQEWILDCRQIVVCDWLGTRVGRANAAYSTPGPPYSPGIFSWKFQASDIAGVGGTDDTDILVCEVSVLTWVSDGTTNGKVRWATDTAGDTIEQTIGVGQTTPTWTALAEIDLVTNGGTEILTVDMRRTAGAGTTYIGAFFVITKP